METGKVIKVDFKNKKVIGKTNYNLSKPEGPDADKLEYFSKLITEGLTTVKFDTRVKGVSVPANLADIPDLLMNWSFRFNLHDFAFDKDSVRGTLSFNHLLHFVVIPWSAIYIIGNKTSSRVWAESVPVELQEVPVAEKPTRPIKKSAPTIRQKIKSAVRAGLKALLE